MKKLLEIRAEAEREMMGNDEKALFATGRYVASSLLLDGMTPDDVLFGYTIFPAHWPQRQAAETLAKQFKGLI